MSNNKFLSIGSAINKLFSSFGLGKKPNSSAISRKEEDDFLLDIFDQMDRDNVSDLTQKRWNHHLLNQALLLPI